jgi:serine/threonine-protein kinase
MAASISAGLALIYGLLSLVGIISTPGFDAWILIDAAILGGLAYGVWRRSRVCAVLLVIYGIVNEVSLALQENARFSLLALVFLYFYIRGAIQIIRDHREQFLAQPTNT